MKSAAVLITLTALFCIGCGSPGRYDLIGSHAPHQAANLRIAGSKEATPHSVPYIAYIKLTLKPGGAKTRICAGSLLSRNYVLTAKGCLINAIDAEIILGLHDVNDVGSQQEVQQIKNVLASTTVHEEADLALIKLNTPVDQKPGIIGYALLPKKTGSGDRYKYKFKQGKVYGWGAETMNASTSNVLRYAVSSVMDCGGCGGPQIICGDVRPVSIGPCEGDAGDPYLVEADGEILQIGVLIHRALTCEERNGFTFTEVPQYLDWIDENSDAHVRP